MECNRDEALRAKSIAEDKIQKKDFAGAKKFALKAKSLYPDLDGIAPILTTLDVYISAENKVSGEVDWYGVLGVHPSADDESIRKQYRKLALALHPDKNKSVGADGAFKLISEAWSLLSDKSRRLVYNQRRSSKGFQQRVVPTHTGGPSAPPRSNGHFNFSSRSTTIPKPKPAPPQQRTDTFWTICHGCKMHYEYLKMYLNTTLICPNCKEAFTAVETDPPFSFSNVPPIRNAQTGSNSFRYPQHNNNNNQQGPILRTDPSIAAKAANVVQQAQDKLKRSYTESHHASAVFEGFSKKNKLDYEDDRKRFGMPGNVGFGPGSRFYGFSGNYGKPNSTRDLTPVETRRMLIADARNEILKKVNTWRSKTTTTKEKSMTKERKKEKQEITSEEGPTAASMNVPDPDFHDFDEDRSETSFRDNEVWAAYDDDDGMPRFYALVSKVISRKPFKLKISWLNSKTNTEFSTLDWVGSGFYKTSGQFRVGRYETCSSINSFSQKVNWSKGPHGSILILPKKGDIWALYKNWSPKWDEHTPDEVIHEYEMATVLDDYSEEKGAYIAPLVKVVGFKTVFRPNMEPEMIKRIPKEEMFRFSHRVPNHLLTGEEGENAPKGCLELDPAATPLELLQVINEVPIVPTNTANAGEEVIVD